MSQSNVAAYTLRKNHLISVTVPPDLNAARQRRREGVEVSPPILPILDPVDENDRVALPHGPNVAESRTGLDG